jgi:hypothetical protein
VTLNLYSKFKLTMQSSPAFTFTRTCRFFCAAS